MLREPHTGGKVRRYLRLGLTGKQPLSNQPAIGYQVKPVGMNGRLDKYRAGLMAVELKGREKIHSLDGLDMPARQHPQSSFGKGFNAHYTWQHGRAVDLVIVQERLNFRIESRLDDQRLEKTGARDLAGHWHSHW